MTLEQGLGMLTLGIFAIFIGGLIAYFIITKLKIGNLKEVLIIVKTIRKLKIL